MLAHWGQAGEPWGHAMRTSTPTTNAERVVVDAALLLPGSGLLWSLTSDPLGNRTACPAQAKPTANQKPRQSPAKAQPNQAKLRIGGQKLHPPTASNPLKTPTRILICSMYVCL